MSWTIHTCRFSFAKRWHQMQTTFSSTSYLFFYSLVLVRWTCMDLRLFWYISCFDITYICTQLGCFGEIIEPPVSLNATLGSIAKFHCSGQGDVLFWYVDGLSYKTATVMSRGITDDIEFNAETNVLTSKLIVPCSWENNNTNISCVVYEASQFQQSNVALLLIQGIHICI